MRTIIMLGIEMDCVHIKIESALDRFQESHYWIHLLEENYHHADPFRWYLNSFLKAIKEIPQLIQMELQNQGGFTAWYKPKRTELENDILMKMLSKTRDVIVHKKMLLPNSHGELGITEGRGMKLGLTFPIHPLEDSADAMERYLHIIKDKDDFLCVLMLDDDSMPCVKRVWKIEGFDDEVISLCAAAWEKVGGLIVETLKWLGDTDSLDLSLKCRHSNQKIQYQLFDRNTLINRYETISTDVNT